MTQTQVRGTLQDMAQAFANALEANNAAAAQDLLASWSDAYWGIRTELDGLTSWIAEQRALGQPITPSWLNQQRRLKAVLATAKAELDKYAAQGARAATRAQEQALRAATSEARRLASKAVADSLPGLSVDLGRINPKNLETMLGFLQDGTPLANHFRRTVPAGGLDALKDALTRGLTQGWDQRRMVREFTEALAISHTRAVTIVRTESLRIYRETSRQTYAANTKVLESWTWQCALDRRSCMGCVSMHGTKHPVEETLDGHPRCRCAMIPNTKSWADLGLDGLPDTRPTIERGTAWFQRQTPSVQRAMMGPRKYEAWKAGEFGLDDVVARHYDPAWGTMRTERSLKAIRENRNANYGGLDTKPTPTVRPQDPADLTDADLQAEFDALMANAPTSKSSPEVKARARAIMAERSRRQAAAKADALARLDRITPEGVDDAMANVNAARYGLGPEWGNNCTNASLAYEMRRRGYDVTAAPRSKGRPLREVLEKWGVKPSAMRESTHLQMVKTALSLGEGARGVITVVWKGGRSSHIFNWEVRNGEVIFPDAQPGKFQDLTSLRQRSQPHVYWWQLDNLDLPTDLDDWVREWTT